MTTFLRKAEKSPQLIKLARKIDVDMFVLLKTLDGLKTEKERMKYLSE